MFSTILFVALGGAIGAVLRYLVGLAVAFPTGTMAVNVIGSFVIGLVWAQFANKAPSPYFMPFVMTGILGGFTTFSTFSLDTLRLVQDGRVIFAGGYVVISVLLSLLACAAGLYLAKGGPL